MIRLLWRLSVLPFRLTSLHLTLPPTDADVTSIFRALSSVSPPEHSRRALDITEHVIRLNPAHYTVWQYRFQTLLAINADLMEELEWSGEFARDNLKSYQVW